MGRRVWGIVGASSFFACFSIINWFLLPFQQDSLPAASCDEIEGVSETGSLLNCLKVLKTLLNMLF